MSEQQHSWNFNIKSHGCQVDINTVLKLEDYLGCSSSESNLKKQILLVLTYIDESKLCRGILLCEGEEITTLIPHVSSELSDLSDPEKRADKILFLSMSDYFSWDELAMYKLCAFEKGRQAEKVTERKPTVDKPSMQ